MLKTRGKHREFCLHQSVASLISDLEKEFDSHNWRDM